MEFLCRILCSSSGRYRKALGRVVQVSINQTVRTDFSLAIGAVTQNVTVEAIATAIKTDDATVSESIGMLVAETSVPVVPCRLIGTFEALPPERNFPRPVSIKLMIGDALVFASTSNDRVGWSQIAASVESRVRDLVA